MGEFKTIGKNVPKKDALAKVLGKSLFAADIELPNMLYGKVLRSTVASAKINSIDTSEAKKLTGVACVLTYKDIPGDNLIGIINKDEPVLAEDKIRRVGDALAIVAAESEEIAEKALSLIKVDIEETKPLFDVFEAMKEDSPKIHGNTNILSKKTLIKGDVDKAFETCDVIIENTYKTNCVAHMFIEPEATIAKYEDGVLTFWCSTQNPHYDRTEVSRVLALPQSRVRGIQATTGGGFGGKLDISTQCHASLLAYYTKRPVKMVREREESMKVSSKRHPIIMKYKTGADKEGNLIAADVQMYGDTGAYGSYGLAVITRAMVHAVGPYEIPNVRVNFSMVYTNNPMCGAMRGFGVPQVAIAHEGQIDALASELNIDPFEIRLKNAYKKGSITATNQKLDQSVGIIETLKQAKAKAKEVIFADLEGRV